MTKRWQLKEKNDAKSMGGRRVKGSGNRWYAPGDVREDTFLIDCKTTDKKSYSVSLATWGKLSDEALFSFRLPMLSLQIQDLELVVLEKADFEKLIKKDPEGSKMS